jgi:hypothetical protein
MRSRHIVDPLLGSLDVRVGHAPSPSTVGPNVTVTFTGSGSGRRAKPGSFCWRNFQASVASIELNLFVSATSGGGSCASSAR